MRCVYAAAMSWLVVDIGGTNTRCAIAGPDIGLGRVASFRNRDHPGGPRAVLAGYLAGLPPGRPPARAAPAIAAVVSDDTVTMTTSAGPFPYADSPKLLASTTSSS